MTPPPTDSSTGAVAAPAAPAGAAGASCEVAAVGARDAAMPPFRFPNEPIEAWTNDTNIAANILGGTAGGSKGWRENMQGDWVNNAN